MSQHSGAKKRLDQYATKSGITLKEELGWGMDGIVYSTTVRTAIKSFHYESLYQKERDVYQRLFEHKVKQIAGFSVPELVNYNNDFWVIEMQIVSPPFVLDFATAYLDEEPPYDAEQMKQWESEKREQFEDRWIIVKSIIAEFRQFGIILIDVKPGNIMFGDEGN